MALQSMRVGLARADGRLGPPGWIGLVLLAAAAVVVASAWRQHRLQAMTTPSADSNAAAVAAMATPVFAPASRMLPLASDVPLLLSRIERAATAAGLGWPRADYRVNVATDDAPASLEVRCTLKGPYPSVRQFVTTLLQDTPALTLKEFSLARTNVETAEVEAKLAIVVYLSGGTGARP